MAWFRGIRYVVPWIAGVFFLAQVSGIIPGHYDHAGAAGTAHAFTHLPGDGTKSPHHHSLLDADDKCCALHGSPGVILAVLDTPAIELVPVRVMARPQAKPAPIPPSLLDRPPKLLPAI
jgi:hypothetical protein